jgi:thiol-disulfide isomerase/thioredoxin
VRTNQATPASRRPRDPSGHRREHAQPRLRPARSARGALVAALVVARLASVGSEGHDGIRVGDPFPDLRRFSLEGSLPEGLEGKVVLVDFWATWCGRCKESFEFMGLLHTRYASRGLVIIAINVDESRAAMEEFLKEHPVNFHVVRDKTKSLVRAISIPAMPTSFVLDRSGKVHSIFQGVHGADTRLKCATAIDDLLKIRGTD